MKRFPLWFITLGLAAGAVYYWQPGASTQPQATAASQSAAPRLPSAETPLPPKVPVATVSAQSASVATSAADTKREGKATEASSGAPVTAALRKPNPSVTRNPGLAATAQPKFSDDAANGYAALELAQHMEGLERINTVRAGITLLTNANVNRAVAMANELTNQHDHGVAVGTVVRLVSERNPQQAAEILFQQVPPETALALIQYPRTAEVMRQVLDMQVQADPGVAVQWAAQFSSGESVREAQAVVKNAWAVRDPAAASSYQFAIDAGTQNTFPESMVRQLKSDAAATLPATKN